MSLWPKPRVLENIDREYGEQVNRQVARITAELNALDQLLTAGRVDRRVLVEFRDAVNRIRATSWNVQSWIDAYEDEGKDLAAMMLRERMRIASQVSAQLSEDLGSADGQTNPPELKQLQESVTKLHWTLIRLTAAGPIDPSPAE
jgi:hypothetical protein